MRSLPLRARVRPVALAALAALAACTGATRVPAPRELGAGSPTPRRGGTLRISVNDDVSTLDPALAYDEYTNYVTELLFDTLVAYAPATAPDPLALEPQLAERWEIGDGGTTYTFHIRPDARFSDGQPVLAEDFVFQLERVLDPKVSSPGAGYYAGIVGAAERLAGRSEHVAGLRARGEHTLEIRLERPDPTFPMLLAMKFATPQKRSHARQVGARLREAPLGTGPFMLRSWSQGVRLELARNPRYWNRERPYLDGVVIDLLVPRDVATLKFLRGELDTVERLSASDQARFAQTPEWTPYLLYTPRMDVFAELMNVTRPPFSDRRVRQAMNYAISKQDTVRLYGGRAVASSGLLPPLMPGHDPALRPYPHDPERARRLLAEAGYPRGFEVTYTTTADEMNQKIAQSIQADLAEVGVRMRIQTVTFPAWLAAAGRGALDFAWTSWIMDFPDASNFLVPKFHSRSIAPENSTNDSHYASPEVDRLLDEAAATLDGARRVELYRRVEAVLYEDCPYVWHYHTVALEVRQPYVAGYRPHPVWRRDYRDTWLDEPRRGAGAGR